ncbi:Spore germination protein YndE [Paenibacillus solanacearum]|uniref:Spore germination protein YndE n=1 Tax=Paenibacillus solanacearum TaxID=2048548 RepID=A0A916K8Y5_9BACL|nr:GerAB/ArcD/ProY family transporter [Paenibacillus solanacearum]CAG7646650.1 Spore germination protein YndE [Paenibacillus solanacearum]
MTTTKAIRSAKLIRAYAVFFCISGTQLAEPSQGFQRTLYKAAGHDAWICLLLMAPISMAAAFFIAKTAGQYGNKDLYAIHEDVYGRWLAKLPNLIYAVYLFLMCLTIVHSYAEVVQTWLFPDLQGWLFAGLLCLLFIYGIIAGIHAIAGFATMAFILSLWLFLLMYFPLKFASIDNLLPVLEANARQIWSGVYQSTYLMLGMELVYFLYPFVQDKQNVRKFSQLAVLATVLTYIISLLCAILFYSGKQLTDTLWPTYTWYKVVQFPFLERFEVVAAAYWLMLVLPNCLLYLWCCTRGLRSVFGMKQQYALYLCCAALVVMIYLMPGKQNMAALYQVMRYIGGALVFLYPVLLFALVQWKKGRMRKTGGRAA